MRKINITVILAALLAAGAAGSSWGADVSMHKLGGKSGLPDTGQTQCYDNGSPPLAGACPNGNAGQDGDYSPAAAAPSYRDNGDFTVTDNRTGLMWKRCTEGKNNDATCTGTAATYVWTSALSQCETLTFAGYSDWRLPNMKELISILNYANLNPSINITYFPSTINGFYWSGTTYVGSTPNAWYVYFADGGVTNSLKVNTYYARCVRAGP